MTVRWRRPSKRRIFEGILDGIHFLNFIFIHPGNVIVAACDDNYSINIADGCDVLNAKVSKYDWADWDEEDDIDFNAKEY